MVGVRGRVMPGVFWYTGGEKRTHPYYVMGNSKDSSVRKEMMRYFC